MNKSLFLKIFAGFVIVILAMAGLTLLLSYRTVRNYHLDDQRESLVFMAEGMKPVFSGALAVRDAARLDSLAEHLGIQTDSRITIIDPEGVIRHSAINADYTVRPDPGETLTALKELF